MELGRISFTILLFLSKIPLRFSKGFYKFLSFIFTIVNWREIIEFVYFVISISAFAFTFLIGFFVLNLFGVSFSDTVSGWIWIVSVLISVLNLILAEIFGVDIPDHIGAG